MTVGGHTKVRVLILIETLNMFKVDESARESMGVHDSWRLNKSEG